MKVFVVTPSYNQGRFLRETIESVLAQGYPRLDYFVADGGSTDESVEILRGYGDRVKWVSRPDGGQAAAIAEAWGKSDADVLAWLNSDDVYEPGAVVRAVDHLRGRPGVAAVYGQAWLTDREGRKTGAYPTQPWNPAELFHSCFLCQPATFVRRSAIAEEKGPDPALHYCLDYDLWIRLARRAPFAFLDEVLARARMYPENKTLGHRDRVFREIIAMSTRHFGIASRNWTVTYAMYRAERRVARTFGFLSPARRKRLRSWLVRRAEARLVGPLYADRWAGRHTRLEVLPDTAGRVALLCEVPFWPYRRPLGIRVRHRGRTLVRRRVETPGAFRIDLRLASADPAVLRIDADRTFVPEDWGYSPDARPMSFLIRAVEDRGR